MNSKPILGDGKILPGSLISDRLIANEIGICRGYHSQDLLRIEIVTPIIATLAGSDYELVGNYSDSNLPGRRGGARPCVDFWHKSQRRRLASMFGIRVGVCLVMQKLLDTCHVIVYALTQEKNKENALIGISKRRYCPTESRVGANRRSILR